MTIDVVDLREFYATPLGRAAALSLTRAFRKYGGLDEAGASLDMVGIGYAVPLFEEGMASDDGKGNENTPTPLILMPARQGAIKWPVHGPSRTALVDEDELPIETASVQCVVLLHLLENVPDPAAMLDEVWRILVPEGKLILVAANRRGLWARFEHTPFGNGRPFSRGQLGRLLRKAKLAPVRWGDCLNFPPMRYNRLMRAYPWIERIAHRAWPVFCGAYVVIAKKRLYQGVTSTAKQEKRVLVPAMSGQSARSSNTSRSRHSPENESSHC